MVRAAGLNDELRKKLQAQIEHLNEQMQNDNNDLEYETHLHMKKDLESILKSRS